MWFDGVMSFLQFRRHMRLWSQDLKKEGRLRKIADLGVLETD